MAGWARGLEGHGHLAPDHVIHGRARVLVRNVLDLGARLDLEHLANDVPRRTRPGRGKGQITGLALGDDVLDAAQAGIGIDGDDKGRADQRRYRREMNALANSQRVLAGLLDNTGGTSGTDGALVGNDHQHTAR